MESEQDENKQVSGDESLEGENGHKRIHSEETESVIIHSETLSRSSSSSSSASSSSSSSYLSPPKHLPEDDNESSSNDPEVSPTDSPPVQVMDREDNNNGDQGTMNYDPNRIPSSVFERSKSNIPAEWSCTSNESLFSIHLGRNSFTVDTMKSGELYKSGELLAYSPALPMPPPPGGESNAAVLESKVVDSDKEDEKVVVVVDETHKDEDDKRDSHDEKEQLPAVSWKTPTTSYRSNQSLNSTQSFSFPILAGAASDSASVETEDKKKQAMQSQDTEQPAEVGNKKHSTMCEKKILLHPNVSTCAQESVSVSVFDASEGIYELGNTTSSGELHLIGSTLQLRGTNPIIQPLVDSSGNILAYNGEVFGGIELNSYDNDTEVLLKSLEKAKSLVPDVLSMIKGPWAIIYWQESSRTLWFGKDAFGRRSLLVHWPTVEDPRFLLSSVSPASSVANGSGLNAENGYSIHRFWEELPCGVYSISFGASRSSLCIGGEVTKQEWRNTMWKDLIEWERNLVVPRPEDLSMSSLSGIQEEKNSAVSTFSGTA